MMSIFRILLLTLGVGGICAAQTAPPPNQPGGSGLEESFEMGKAAALPYWTRFGCL